MKQDPRRTAGYPWNEQLGLVGFCVSLMGILTCGLTALPGLVISGIALVRWKRPVFAGFGLLISGYFGLLWLSWLVPSEAMPRPLGVAQFRMNAPGSFWARYGKGRVAEARTEYWWFGGSGGALLFEAAEQGTFRRTEIIAFAERHNWEHTATERLTARELRAVLADGWGKELEEEALDADDLGAFGHVNRVRELVRAMQMGKQFPVWIVEDCEVLVFRTSHMAPSHVVINARGDRMAVYCNAVR